MAQHTVLVVDDRESSAQLIVEYLNSAEDYNILIASNGPEAIELCRHNSPDIVVMDWDMPGMTGIEASYELKKDTRTKDIPVIIASGIHLTSENLKEALESGAVDFLRKPINEVELIARIQSVLKLYQSYRENAKQREEKKLLEEKAKNEMLKLELDTRNKQLASKALYVVKMNEFNSRTISDLKRISAMIKPENITAKNHVNWLIKKIEKNNNNRHWREFEIHFESVHKDFYKKLDKKYPNLTPNERKLSAFFKLNLTPKDVNEITFQEPNAIYKARKRLRKKLGLKHGEHLVKVLNSI